MRIVICDDEKYYTDAIVSFVKRWQEINSIHSVFLSVYQSSEDLNDLLNKTLPYDLAFLDIQFPGELNGLALAQHLRATNSLMEIVFMTSYEEYAMEGYKVNALRFLPKPISDKHVFECLDIAYRRWQAPEKASFLIEGSQQFYRLEHKSILYAESRAHYVYFKIFDSANEIKTRMKLVELLAYLPSDMFVQCHRSYIVNLLHVYSISKNDIILSNKESIPISQKYWKNIHNKFMFFFQGGFHEV